MTKFIVNGKQGYKTYHDWKAFWGMKGAPSTPPTPAKEPFYIENDGGSSKRVSIKKATSAAPTVPIEYSLDGTTWQSLGSTSTTALTINVPAKSKVWLRAVTNGWATGYNDYNTINISDYSSFNIGGDILSLLYGANYKEATTITQSNAFRKLFYHTRVYDASELILPDTQPSTHCYNEMFEGCNQLHQAPALPATTLAENCYANMFNGCYNLQQAPALPATTLARECYSYMFYGCNALQQAPELPATTMFTYCYLGMFQNCYNLHQVPALPATTLAYGCYSGMFSYCSTLHTAQTILPATTLAEDCYSDMFSYCSSLETAPELPATTLAANCYYEMFLNCQYLQQAPELPATTLVSMCYNYMFQGCFRLKYIKCLATEDEYYSGDFRSCCDSWVDGVSGSGTFIASDNYSSGWYWGKDGVPENWTTETESGNPFEPTQGGGGGGTQIYQSNGLTVYEMGGEQGGYQVQANGSNMEVPDFNGNDYCFAMMKISADQGWGGNYAYMTPHTGGGVTAYVSNEVSDDGTCPFSYMATQEYDNFEYVFMNGNDDGNQISPYIMDGNCRWVKFVKNQGTYDYNTPYITMDF